MALASFELIYDEEGDVLEVTFASFDESFARAIPLNDNIELLTDTAFARVWGLRLYSYAQLLQVSETYLDGLLPLNEADLRRVLGVLNAPPASHFLQLLDPINLRALVKAPALDRLILS